MSNRSNTPTDEAPQTELGKALLEADIDAIIWHQYWFMDEWLIDTELTVPSSRGDWCDEGALMSRPENDAHGVFGFIRKGEVFFHAGRLISETYGGRLTWFEHSRGEEKTNPHIGVEISREELELAIDNADKLKGKGDLTLRKMKNQLVKLATGDPAPKRRRKKKRVRRASKQDG